MRTKLSTFRYPVELSNAHGDRFEEAMPWVDTGALYSQFPSSLLRALGYEPNALRSFRLADGRVVESPVGPVSLRLNGEVQPVLCVFAEEGSDPLLGATTLEAFSLAVDPVNEILVPTIALRLSMASVNELEEGAEVHLDFDKLAKLPAEAAVVPCAVQNVDTGEVILVAYVNELALKTAVDTRSAVFWSTSRNELWEKGKTSGETFDLLEVRVNCEQNSLLFLVRPRRRPSTGSGRSGICHTKNQAGEPRDCFYRRLDFETWKLENLNP